MVKRNFKIQGFIDYDGDCGECASTLHEYEIIKELYESLRKFQAVAMHFQNDACTLANFCVLFDGLLALY
jgi:hypothetical protein